MNCPRCGQENDDQAQFCRRCGAALHEPVQQRGIQRWVTDTKILAYIGLIAGVLALVGVFSPWATYPGGYSPNISAWDAMTGLTVWDYRLYQIWAGLAFGGALLLLGGALSALAAPRSKAPWVVLHIGGALAIIGFAAAVSEIRDGGFGYPGYGYGLYLTLVGGILGLTGVMGLRGTSSASLPKSAKRDSEFSQSSGGTFQGHVRERGIQEWITDRKIVGRVGLLASVLALAGVFTRWSNPYLHLSMWDAMTGRQFGDEAPLYEVWAGLAFGAALILLVGALYAVAAPKAKAPWVILHVGGAVAMAAFAAAVSYIREDPGLGYGYGLYLILFGGLLGLTGILGLRGSFRSHGRLETESK
jgi:uncharacterized BrkB/YihY/UPF0761 family membrane protein